MRHALDTLTTGGIAQILNVSADTVRRHWPTWSKEKGFPRPLTLPTDSTRALLRWDKAAVTAWTSFGGGGSRGEGDGGASIDNDFVDWAAVARARGLALDRGQDPDALH